MRPAQAGGRALLVGAPAANNTTGSGRGRSHLARGRVKMRRGDIQKVVLYEVQERWHAHEHRVSPVDDHALPHLGKSSSTVLPQHHQKGGRNLCCLRGHNCSRR